MAKKSSTPSGIVAASGRGGPAGPAAGERVAPLAGWESLATQCDGGPTGWVAFASRGAATRTRSAAEVKSLPDDADFPGFR